MQFLNGHLPSQLEYDLVKSMRKCDGMTNAKPDRILGLTRNRFGMSEHLYLWPEIRDLLHIVDDNIWHPFFFIEGKGNQGLVFEAENQARRAGASLVSSLRMFLTKIGIDDVASPGPDNRTFVFSATLSSNALKFWVHWAELQEDRSVHYQMDYVDGCLWQQTERLADMRRVMANIQDWGCGKRRVQLLKYHEKLHTLLQQKMDEGANRRGSGHHSFSATTFAPTSHIV